MSNIPLTDIQTIIERTIFERIRQEIVDKGYLPDITLYPDDEAGLALYNSDKNDIILSKGFAIDVFSESGNANKGLKQIPRVVIKSGNFLAGDIGGDPKKYFEPNPNGGFSAKVLPPQTANFYLNIHAVTANVTQERMVNAILALAVPRRKYVNYYNDPTSSFFIRFLNFFEIDDNDHSVLEKIFAYEVPDCWDMEIETISENISAITRIDLSINLQKYYDNSITTVEENLTIFSTLKVNINSGSSISCNLQGN